MSQSVEPLHPSGLTFLFRDCTNVSNVSRFTPWQYFSFKFSSSYRYRYRTFYYNFFLQFFSKWGVPDLPTEHELFNKITGLDLEEGSESETLSQLVSFQKDRLQKSGLEGKVRP